MDESPAQESPRKWIEETSKTLEKLRKELRSLEKLSVDPAKSAYLLEPAAEKALALLGDPAVIGERLSTTAQWLKGLSERARTAQQRARSQIPAALARELESAGLKVEGMLPTLRCGVFTLQFLLEAKKPSVTIEYGPGVARLKRVELDAPAVAREILTLHRSLNDPPLDSEAFLRELRMAYRIACLREGVSDDGHQVPLTTVMAALAMQRQTEGFVADPVREKFHSYGRVHFSYDLFRLRIRELDGEELKLSIATRQQTRKPADHLWVPTGPGGQGTNFSTLSFRRKHERI